MNNASLHLQNLINQPVLKDEVIKPEGILPEIDAKECALGLVAPLLSNVCNDSDNLFLI